MRTTAHDPDGWATPPRGPRHAAPPFRLLAPRRLVAWSRAASFHVTDRFHITGRVRPAGPSSTAGPFNPAAAFGPATPAELRARRALRLFVTVGIWAAGLLLVVGFLVLVVSVQGSHRTGPLVAGSSLAFDGHHAALTHGGDHRSGRPAQQPPVTGHPAGHGGGTARLVRTGVGRGDGPGRATRPLASFAGHGDMITRRFAVGTNAGWQIVWSYSCPASGPAGLLVVENAAPGAVGTTSGPVGTVISASGAAGHGDTWLDPDGRSHQLVVISTCSWTMKVIQDS